MPDMQISDAVAESITIWSVVAQLTFDEFLLAIICVLPLLLVLDPLTAWLSGRDREAKVRERDVTCDSMDYMKGPFLLPNNIKENDYIELGQLGAYGLTFRTQFNGFYSNEIYEVEDEPIMTLYGKESNKGILVA